MRGSCCCVRHGAETEAAAVVTAFELANRSKAWAKIQLFLVAGSMSFFLVACVDIVRDTFFGRDLLGFDCCMALFGLGLAGNRWLAFKTHMYIHSLEMIMVKVTELEKKCR